MIECYHDEIEFSDPGFPYLKGKRAKSYVGFFMQNLNAQLRYFGSVRGFNLRTMRDGW